MTCDKTKPCTDLLTKAKLLRWLLLTSLLVALLLLLSLGIGSGEPGFVESIKLIFGGTGDARSVAILQMRGSRVALGFFAGAGLAGVGVVLQLLLRNPLADPYVVGVSGGAALSATLTIMLLGQGPWVAPLAFGGAALASFFTLGAARVRGRSADMSVLLIGVVVNSFAAAVITFVKTLVAAQKAQEILFWLVGFITYSDPLNVVVVAVAVSLSLLLLMFISPQLQLMSLGEDSAARLGVSVNKIVLLALTATSLATGAVVSQTGMIGFIGLIVPHALRLIVGPDPRLLLPVSALIGGATLVLVDALTRGLFQIFYTEVPVGALCALIGAPIFIYLLRRSMRGPQF